MREHANIRSSTFFFEKRGFRIPDTSGGVVESLSGMYTYVVVRVWGNSLGKAKMKTEDERRISRNEGSGIIIRQFESRRLGMCRIVDTD